MNPHPSLHTMEWPDSSLSLKKSNGTQGIKWTLRTDSEAYLDGLEAKLKRTKVPTSNRLPPPTSSLGLQPQPEDLSDLEFGDEGDEEDELVEEQRDEEGREEGGQQEWEEEEQELIDDALLDDPGLALLWDSPRELQPQPFTSLPSSSPSPSHPPPTTTSASSSLLLLPSSPPSAIPVRPRSQSITFSDDAHLLHPPLNSYTSTLTNSTTTTHSNSTSSSSASPSTSYTRPNRFLNSSSPTPNNHPHRDRTLSRSRSRSSFTTISESPSPPGSLTPTSLNQHSSLPPPQPVPEPPVRRSVRFNPRTLLRPSSFGSYSSDRSGELVSSSPLRGFMAWRLGGGPIKPNNNGNGRTSPNGFANASSSSSTNPRNARVQKMPQVQSWTNYYGTFSNTSAEEIRGNPLLYEPVSRPSTSTHPHGHGSSVRKSEEDVLFGTGLWERVSSLDWWCWKMGVGAWWESEGSGGMCCGTGWEEDDWGEQQSGSSRTARAVGEGRGFF